MGAHEFLDVIFILSDLGEIRYRRFASNVIEQCEFASNVIEQCAFASNVIEQSEFASNVFEQYEFRENPCRKGLTASCVFGYTLHVGVYRRTV
jgi:hypothetical protein